MNHDESVIQAQIVAYFSRLPCWCYCVKNDGAKSIRQAGRDKAMGVKAGTADIAIIGSDGITRYMEVKANGGRLSASQKVFRAWCENHGTHYAVAYSLDEAIAIAKTWGLTN